MGLILPKRHEGLEKVRLAKGYRVGHPVLNLSGQAPDPCL